jgi:hypothetical protein
VGYELPTSEDRNPGSGDLQNCRGAKGLDALGQYNPYQVDPDDPERYYLLPKEFAPQFARAGIKNLDDYTIRCQPGPLIDPGQWDGSDFFTIWPLPKCIFVSARVTDVIRAECYQGVKLVPADEVRFGMRSETVCELGPGPPPAGRYVRGPEAYPRARIRRWDGVPRRPDWVLRGEEPPVTERRRRKRS